MAVRDPVSLSIDISPDLYDRLQRIAADTGSTVGETIAKAIVLMDIAVRERKRSESGHIWVSPAPVTHYVQAGTTGTASIGLADMSVDASGEQGQSPATRAIGTEITGI